MGHHYIPRYYLKGFSTPGDTAFIWRYEKGSQCIRCLPIKSVAQENDYYSSATEKYLAEKIEAPARVVLKKLREQRQMVSPEEKAVLSIYMSVMLTRVPRHRDRINDAIPGIRDSVFAEVEERLNVLETEERIDKEVLAKRRAEMIQVRSDYEIGLPKDLYESITQPTVRPRIAQGLYDMTWRFISRGNEELLITSDNPIFYFESLGIGNPQSEVSFPISKDILLWATHRSDLSEGFTGPDNRIFKEVNKRTIFNASRYIFSSIQEDWIYKVIGNPKPFLRRIQ